MKKIYLLFLAILLSFTSFSQVSNYSFLQSIGTYQELTAPTAIWTATANTGALSFDTAQQDVIIPFTFTFNLLPYTTINVNSNGSIIFPGTTATSTTSTPISATTTYNGAIAGWGRDINGAYDASFVSSVSYQTIGTAPNRKFVVQYKNVRPAYSVSATAINLINFQIHLEETTNIVRIVYGPSSTFIGSTYNSSTVQIGLRGATNADFLNRTNAATVNFNSSTSGTLNSSSQAFNNDPTSVQGMPGLGLTYSYTPPPLCTGTPATATAVSSVPNACANTPFNLSLPNFPIFRGLTYQWQSSPAGANTFTNIVGATTSTYTVASQTTPTDYRCIVTCTNGGATSTSNIVNVGQNLPLDCYCVPTGGSTYYLSGISSAGGIANFNYTASAYSTYQDRFSTISFAQAPGSAVNILMAQSSGTGYHYCWVDWNQDGDFADTGETIWATTSFTANYNGSIPVPAGTTPGTYRVRFANSWSGVITPCGPNANGGYVDVKLVVPSPCVGAPTAGTSVSSVPKACANTPFSLSLSGVTIASGLTFQWQSSPAGTNTFTNITGATASGYTVANQTTATDYRCIVTCTNGGATSTSSIVSVGQNVPMDCYCIPTAANTYYLNNITSTNGFTNFVHTATAYSAYQDKFSTLSFSQKEGGSVNISMTPSSGTNYYYCWVDWNQDGDFEDAGETIWATTSFMANHNGVITVPVGQALGTYRVRFANSWSGVITPCGHAANGSYVDVALKVTIPPPPTITITHTNNICFGGNTGTASAVITHGSAPFTYLWSPSGGTAATATGLTAGVYTVTVTDALSRTATATVTITQPDEILANGLITNVACHGANNGSITLSPTGGTLPYSYLWNTGSRNASLSNLVAGTYSVTITDGNSCVKTESFTITEPTVLTTSGTQVDVSTYKGSDGSATVSASGGTAPYTYLWSNGVTGSTASGLTAGTYTVTVTDANGCTSVLDFVITQPIPLMIQSVSQTNVSCNGGNDGTATVVVIGGNAPYTYQWSPTGGTGATATGLTAGTYSVLITEATGDAITETFTITEPQAILASISQKTDITCNFASNGTATVTVSGGTAPYTYFWSNGMTTATANNLNVGTYNVQVVDAKGCKATAMVSITQPAALVLTSNFTDISCYGQNDGSASVSVTGGVGPYTYSWSNGQVGTGISNLAKGTYVVTITDTNNCVVTKSFIITEPAFVHPPVAFNQDFCTGQNVTLANVVITGSNIKWYSSANGNTLLPASTVLTNGTTYYASQTVGTCESSTRVAVKITLNQGTPLTTTQLNVCSNTRVQNMTIDGFNHTQLRWYNTVNSTTVIPVIQMLVTGTYYVSSVTGTCESARQAIQVTVAAAVPAPTASSQVVCGNSTLNDLAVVKDPSATLRWYSSLQSLIPLANTTVVSNGTYYVQQLIGGCESIKVAVSVQVINVSVPTMTSIITCEGNTIADLHPTTGQYVWYLNSSTTTALPDTFVITPGSYYLAYQNTGCISNKVNVAVTVNARPASPTGQLNQFFGGSARVSDLQMNQPNVSWFATYDDAVKQLNQLATTYPLQDKATYYGILKGTNNCGSLVPTAVTVRLNLSNAELDLTQLKYYPNPVDSELNISYIEEIKKVEVFTITGQRVFGNDYQGNEVKVDLSRLSAGTYLVKIETAKASQFVKIVKR